MRPHSIALALCLAAMAAPAAAHDTWIGPVAGPAAPGTAVGIDLTSGGAFPAPEAAPAADRVSRATVRLAGESTALAPPSVGRTATRFSAPLRVQGVAAIAVALRPKRLELAADKIREYLEEIGALESAGAAWDRRPGPKTWIEVYSKHAKTFVRVGAAAGDDSWKQPVGLALEIVPERDPTALSAGDELPVRVLKNGAPLPGFALAAEHGPASPRQTLRTDAAGRAVFILPSAGPWLLAGTELRAAPDGATWESDFTTLTVVLAPSAGLR